MQLHLDVNTAYHLDNVSTKDACMSLNLANPFDTVFKTPFLIIWGLTSIVDDTDLNAFSGAMNRLTYGPFWSLLED